MPKIKVRDITMNYDQQGTGEPLILVPYLAAERLLRFSGRRLRQALHMYLAGPQGQG